MSAWEFLRRPVRLKEEKDKSCEKDNEPEIVFVVAFGNTEKEYLLKKASTFETIYCDYEQKFLRSLALEYNNRIVSRYSKAYAVWEEFKAEPSNASKTKIPLFVKLKTPNTQAAKKITYNIRYKRNLIITVERENEATVEELDRKVRQEIESREGQQIEGFLYFDGMKLNLKDSIDSVLMDGDLVDFTR